MDRGEETAAVWLAGGATIMGLILSANLENSKFNYKATIKHCLHLCSLTVTYRIPFAPSCLIYLTKKLQKTPKRKQ